jgi:hypothetical protein
VARIKNDPAKYVSRSKNLPSFDGKAEKCRRRVEERERSYLEAPISESFYIDHRRPVREDRS